jgi:hypothetical protein
MNENDGSVFLWHNIYTYIYTLLMNTHPSPQSLLQQIAQIKRMEPGKLCVLRQAADGPYYNLQCRQDGKTVTRYVPRAQAEAAAAHTANYAQFEQLIQQYVRLVAEQSRAEREAGFKKKTAPRTFFSPRKKKSSS